MVDKWIRVSNAKKGALSRQLGIAVRDNIPVTLLKEIKYAKKGEVVYNPTQTGVRKIRATPLLKRRVNFALNIRK